MDECTGCPTAHAIDVQRLCGADLMEVKDQSWAPLDGPGSGDPIERVRWVRLEGPGCFRLRFMDLEEERCAHRGVLLQGKDDYSPRVLALQSYRWSPRGRPAPSCAAAIEAWRERAR